jgi:hypothetical protein
MMLLALYGAPATGKLTIAQQIVEQTGFKLFHNHVSIDVAKRFFDRRTPSFDTSIQSAEQSVAQIIKHFQLTKQLPESS